MVLDSGDTQTVKVGYRGDKVRMCRSTYRVETLVLDAVEAALVGDVSRSVIPVY